MSINCPTCGRAYPKAKARPAESVNLAEFTEGEVYAYYKRTALIEDLRFFLRFPMSDALRARAEAITKPTRVDLSNLRSAWRTERLRYWQSGGIPALGSPAWREGIVADAETLTVIAS